MKGAEEVAKRMVDAANMFARIAEAALFQEAQDVKLESMRRTPVDTGALRASHEVMRPRRARDVFSVNVQVGGPAAGYAVPVHEDLEARHPVGQAKFLESAINDARPGFAQRVVDRMRL